jgi:dTDP-4-amino-4,6-dideoxygalactose transaminase
VQIPFVNLRLQYESIQNEIDEAVKGVFTKSQFVGGENVRRFENEFAKAFHSNHCISTGNGTDSLFIILKGLGISAGDEVITPAFSCIASSEVISLTGAKIVFVDVDPKFYTIDLEEVKKKITSKTKAVIAVHLYGQAAPVTELKKICDERGLFLVEDCAQAHFTEENSAIVGTIGIASAFSFYPTKNLGAFGDGGCILTQDNLLAEKMRRLANHGALQKDDHELEGTNSRLDSLQAAMLSVKLKHLQKWNSRRIQIAKQYTSLLNSCSSITTPVVRNGTNHTFHIYGIRCKQRNMLKEFLDSQGIATMIHYPKGMPYTNAYQFLQHTVRDFPVTVQLQEEQLSLPIFPELTDTEVTFIASNILNYFSR